MPAPSLKKRRMDPDCSVRLLRDYNNWTSLYALRVSCSFLWSPLSLFRAQVSPFIIIILKKGISHSDRSRCPSPLSQSALELTSAQSSRFMYSTRGRLTSASLEGYSQDKIVLALPSLYPFLCHSLFWLLALDGIDRKD